MNKIFRFVYLVFFLGIFAGGAPIGFLAGSLAYAGAPKSITYQGTLRKAGAIYTGAVPMEFRITNADGSVVYWTSGSTSVYVSAGLFRYPLGTPNEAQFSAIPWSSASPYIRVIIDGAALPADPLLSTPYALHAGTAEGSGGDFIVGDGDLRISTTTGNRGIVFQDGSIQRTAAVSALTMSGDVTMDNAGVTTIGAAKVTAGMIMDGAITAADIAPAAISLDKLSQSGCAENQIPKWNGSAWACAVDIGGGADIYWSGAATGLDAAAGRASLGLGALATKSAVTQSDISGTISSQTISGLGALAGLNTITDSYISGSISASKLSGALPALDGALLLRISSITAGTVGPDELAATSVSSGTYGDGTSVARFTVDADGRLTSAEQVAITGAAPTGTAGGDLTGSYPNPRIGAGVVVSTNIADGSVVDVDVALTTGAIRSGKFDDERVGITVSAISGLGALATKSAVTQSDISGTISSQTISGLGALAGLDTITESYISGSISPSKINGTVATLGANTFTAAQTILYTNGVAVGLTISSGLVVGAGNVGIGTVAPATKLHVSSGVLTVDGTDAGIITTGALTASNLSGTNTGDNAVNMLYSGLITNATHTGDATGDTVLTVKQINGVALSGLATGILKNTTVSGVPSIALAGTDYLAPTGNGSELSGIIQSSATGTYPLSISGNAATAGSVPQSGVNLSTVTVRIESLEAKTSTAAYLSSPQTFTGANTFASTTSFTATHATLPGVDISSGLIVRAGNLGIGTVAPATKLHVSSGVLTVDGAGAGITTTGNVIASAGAAAAPAYGFGGDLDTGIYSSGANSVSISAGGNEKMRIFSSGNMAFDDFANMPGAASNGTYKVFHFASPTNDGSTILSMASRNRSTSFFGNYIGTFVIGNEGTYPIDFKTNLVYGANDIFAGGTTVMRITGAGSVGIGTVAPATKLHVSSGVLTVDGIGAGITTTGNITAATFIGSGASLTGVPQLASTQTFTGVSSFASTAAFTATNATLPGVDISSGLIVRAGNVGIGTATPAYMLDVLGTTNFPVKVKGSTGGGFILGAYNDQWGGLWSAGVTPSITNYSFIAHPTEGLAFNAPTGGSLQFDINDVVKMYLTANGGLNLGYGTTATAAGNMVISGNVGVGTAAPATKLHVSSGVLTVDGTGAGITTTGNMTAVTFIGSGASLTGVPQLASTQTFTGASSFASTVAFTATNETLPGVDISSGLIVRAGNVGIGTASPAHMLQIGSGTAQVSMNSLGQLSVLNSGVYPNSTYYSATFGKAISIVGSNAGFQIADRANSAHNWQHYSTGDIFRIYKDFGTNGAEPFVIDSTGRIGVGTIAPSTKLHISSGILTVDGTGAGITTTGDMTAATFIGSGASLTGVAQLSSTQTFTGGNTFTGNTGIYGITVSSNVSLAGALYTQNGKVGIGTANPSEFLEVNPGASYAGYPAIKIVSSYADGYNANLILKNAHTGGQEWFIRAGNNQSGGVYSNLQIYQTGAGARFDITAAGNIGIGTTAPAARLTVISTGTMAYSMAVGTSTAYSMVVSTAGNVGIGTTAPGAPLEVYRDDPTNALPTSIIRGGNNHARLRFIVNDTSDSISEIYKTVSDYSFNFYTSPSYNNSGYNFYTAQSATVPKLSIKNDGTVGIGTTAPAAGLAVISGTSVAYSLAVGTSAASYQLAVSTMGAVTIGKYAVTDKGTDPTTIALTVSDFGNTFISTGTDTTTHYNLPSVTSADVGAQFTFVKLGPGKVTIHASASTYIADSGAGGTIYNDSTMETYACITLRLVTDTKWIIIGGDGNWMTTN